MPIESTIVGEILTYKPNGLKVRVLKINSSWSITAEMLDGEFKGSINTLLFKNLEREGEGEEDFLL